MALRLIQHFGSLGKLLHADYQAFKEFKGIGVSKWAQLRACLEIARRSYIEELEQRNNLQSIGLVKDFLINTIGHKPYEVFTCLFLDPGNQLICAKELFRGTVDCATVHVREVLKECLDLGCSNLIVAHNHPSGELKPSADDLELTAVLAQALSFVQIYLLDHLIVSKNGAISLHEQGFI